MVENRRVCSFCGNPIEPGTGKLYVKRDGTTYHFCRNKCQKNMLKLGRVPRNVKWSKKYEKVTVAEKKKTLKKVSRKENAEEGEE